MRSFPRTAVLVLAACLFVSLVCVAYPMYVIRPFRAQGPRELALALEIIRVRPIITVLSVLVSIAIVVGSSTRRRLTVVMAVLVLGLAALARVNVYELMFHPLEHPAFAAASEVKLDKDEKVIAVKLGSVARAYPIRGMSYHHVINDVVNNEPIVATY